MVIYFLVLESSRYTGRMDRLGNEGGGEISDCHAYTSHDVGPPRDLVVLLSMENESVVDCLFCEEVHTEKLLVLVELQPRDSNDPYSATSTWPLRT